MSIESNEYTSQTSNSSGNRAPPPPFTSQRKRPPLSNLGIEVSLASDVKTPNTPTPNFTNEPLNSSDAVLKVRPSSSATSTDSAYHQHPPPHQTQHTPFNNRSNYHDDHHQTMNYIREPQLNLILESLADFQHFYDQKSQRIEGLESQLRHVSDLLREKESELQGIALERIENLRVVESNKTQLRELEGKLKEFGKYETLIGSKFESLEKLMTEMTATRAKYLAKEAEYKQELDEKELRLKDALKSIQELRVEKEALEVQRAALENENKDCCTEFNGKIYELNAETKEKKRTIDLLTGEKEVLLSDLKNITKDRDGIQRECSAALKQITELAVSDKFSSSCDVKDLGNLDCSVSWLKRKCIELADLKTSQELEMVSLKQTIQELQKHADSMTEKLKEKTIGMENLKKELEEKIQELKDSQLIRDEQQAELERIEEFKVNARKIGFVADDFLFFDKILEKLSQKAPEKKLESLSNEIAQMKKDHEEELRLQKEEYGRLLREESAKWKGQREELEAEISQYKRTKLSSNSNNSQSQGRSRNDPDLTAIIKDLKENSSLLNGPTIESRKRSAMSSIGNTTGISSTRNKRRPANTSQNSQKLSSPSSVNSNDIWNLFK